MKFISLAILSVAFPLAAQTADKAAPSPSPSTKASPVKPITAKDKNCEAELDKVRSNIKEVLQKYELDLTDAVIKKIKDLSWDPLSPGKASRGPVFSTAEIDQMIKKEEGRLQGLLK